jgi:hypothetical protein
MSGDEMLRRQITKAEAEILGDHLFGEIRKLLGIPADHELSRAAWQGAVEQIKRALKITAPAPEPAPRQPAKRRRSDKSS